MADPEIQRILQEP
jgi:hypothetical protein